MCHRSPSKALLPLSLALFAVCVAPSPTLARQLGPRTIGNSTTGSLDLAGVKHQISINSADSATKKRTVIKELERLPVEEWQASSLTWLSFTKAADSSLAIELRGPVLINAVKAASRGWEITSPEPGIWRAVAEKPGSKLDLYLEMDHGGTSHTVGATVPLGDDETVGAVYRGVDFLFFVVQKKKPA